VLCLQLFILRKFIEYELSEIGLGSDEVYFCSLSSATVVYKGQLTPEQVRCEHSVTVEGRRRRVQAHGVAAVADMIA
jgi:hypothetical protein